MQRNGTAPSDALLEVDGVTLQYKTPQHLVTATYRVETPLPVDRAAAVLAGEQSSGTFVAVPGETEELRNRYAARVERIDTDTYRRESDRVVAPRPANSVLSLERARTLGVPLADWRPSVGRCVEGLV